MPTRSSTAESCGNLVRGSGTMSLASGAYTGSYSLGLGAKLASPRGERP
jgi:hypothetical protein